MMSLNTAGTGRVFRMLYLLHGYSHTYLAIQVKRKLNAAACTKL